MRKQQKRVERLARMFVLRSADPKPTRQHPPSRAKRRQRHYRRD
jgi:hypothetical protein